MFLEESNAQRSDKPATKSMSSGGGSFKAPIRVYVLDHQQIPYSTEIIEGTISIFYRLAKILIDPGATHSFVKPNFMSGVDVKPVKLPYDSEVRTSTGDHCWTSNLMYENCEIWIEERKLLADLISLPIKRYESFWRWIG